MRHINTRRVIAVQFTTPAENPLLSDDSRLIDVWFAAQSIQKQLFKKVTRTEQDELTERLVARGFVQAGNLLLNPAAVYYAELENELLGGSIVIGWQDSGKPVELKLKGQEFARITELLNGAERT